MKSRTRVRISLFVAIGGVVAMSFQVNDAAAQHYDGCFVNGQQVADSMCQSGGVRGGTPSLMSNPAFGALSSMSFALGAAVGTALRNSLQNAPNNSPPPQADPSAARAEQQRRIQIEQENARAEAERQQRAFRATQHTLIREMHGVDGTPANRGGHAATSTPELSPRPLDNSPEPSNPPPAHPATLRVVNQTESYVTVSVDGAYGCNTAGGTTCLIPVTTGHHDLRAVRTDTGAAYTESVDVPDNGLIWPLSGT